MPETVPDHLLWVDCEFTGLDPGMGHKIIEIGAVITDLALNQKETYQSFVYYDWDYIEQHMAKNPWWTNRHEDRARMSAANHSAKVPALVDTELSELTAEYFSQAKPALCGNSIGNDKRHIEIQLPQFASLLSYRVIDVSSLKLLARMYRGIEYGEKKHKHYALDDIQESIDEFRYLAAKLGIADLSKLAIENT